MEARDVARTAAMSPVALKALAAAGAFTLVFILGSGAITIAGGALGEMEDKARGAQCTDMGIPDISPEDGPPAAVFEEQVKNAQAIDSVAKGRGLSGRATLIALMTALQESGLVNIGHGPQGSLGLFQQRPSQGWGTKEEIMNPRYAARMFFGGNPGKPPGLVDVKGWEKMTPGDAAQTVQRSAHPSLYATQRLRASQIADKALIDLGRAGAAAVADDDQGKASSARGECGSGGPQAVGTPFHDAGAGWPAEVKNPRSTADAIAWARREAEKGGPGWYRRCLAFVAVAYGWRVSGVPYAIDHYRQMPAHMRHDRSRDIPPGALMYWDTGQRAGHVAVYLGDGLLASNDIRRPGYIDVVPATDIERKWGSTYLGWAPPYFPKGS